MKVAVSIPDGVFHDAERVARRLRVPRSHVYARALEAYVRQNSDEEITAQFNRVIDKVGTRVDREWERLGLEVLRREKW